MRLNLKSNIVRAKSEASHLIKAGKNFGRCNKDVRFYMIPTNVGEQFCAVIKSVKISHGIGVYAGLQYSLCYPNKNQSGQLYPIVDFELILTVTI